jgi:hypothetical protein
MSWTPSKYSLIVVSEGFAKQKKCAAIFKYVKNFFFQESV